MNDEPPRKDASNKVRGEVAEDAVEKIIASIIRK